MSVFNGFKIMAQLTCSTLLVLLVITTGTLATCPAPQITLSVYGLRNETGSWEKEIRLNFEGKAAPSDWRVDFEDQVSSSDLYSFTATATLSGVEDAGVPQGRKYIYRADRRNHTFANTTCVTLGGRLAIINSDAEAAILSTLVKEHRDDRATNNIYTFLDFTDVVTEGTFVTGEGQTIQEAGYARWAPREPNNQRFNMGNGVFVTENCGTMNPDGLLFDSWCHIELPFICEFPDSCELEVA